MSTWVVTAEYRRRHENMPAEESQTGQLSHTFTGPQSPFFESGQASIEPWGHPSTVDRQPARCSAGTRVVVAPEE